MTPAPISEETLAEIERLRTACGTKRVRINGQPIEFEYFVWTTLSHLDDLIATARLACRMEAALRAQEEAFMTAPSTLTDGSERGLWSIRKQREAHELRRAIIAELDQGKEPK